MAQYTQHYGLHQWEPEDSFLRTEFNEDLAKIDGALEGLRETLDGKTFVAYGSYSGNGGTQEIELGFRPQVVSVVNNGLMSLAMRGKSSNGLSVTETGLRAAASESAAINVNASGRSYSYLALG